MPILEKRGIVSQIAGHWSRFSSPSIVEPEADDKEGFLKAQRLAYDCVTTIEREIRPGSTEKQIAKLLAGYLFDHGVRTFLHRPFVWFGEHARFDGYKRFTQFHPSNRTLSEEETFILDVSPIVNGYVGDIGYSSSLIPNPILEEGMSFLLSLRDKIPALFLSNLSSREIWWKIDSEIKANGFDNVHAKYPFSVLGHRVYRTKTPNLRLPLIPISFASWFSWQASYEFLSHKILPELLTPDHEGDRLGLWAIEPHLGKGKVGFKFEEILVVEKEKAYWLDDQVPHLRKYKKEDITK
ncbi:metallopeptidase family M24 [Leptospira ryugenii]|uniref:Metallopeptidase family M24 n=1 Tax=Leptospira ryugenii TaxID=1917863 RepID=A0A2P2DZQ5_9LEPT|nr:M24 family metallopeptidase [Leptospira ryugenii]GBF50109.1 metallopeptidase family M24 [Leptospira ryugenii]